MLHGLFADAGFVDVRVETVARKVKFASVADYVRIQLTATPLAALLDEHEPARREHLIALVSADLGDRLALYVHDSGLQFPQELHIALASA